MKGKIIRVRLSAHSDFKLLSDVLSLSLTFITVRQVSKQCLKKFKNGNADIRMCHSLLIVPQTAAVVCLKLTFQLISRNAREQTKAH